MQTSCVSGSDTSAFHLQQINARRCHASSISLAQFSFMFRTALPKGRISGGRVPLSKTDWIDSQKQLGLGWKAMPGRRERDEEAKLLGRAANSTITLCKPRYYFQRGIEVMRFYKVLH